MRKFFKDTLFYRYSPGHLFVCFQYNQCHGYFAESYDFYIIISGKNFFNVYSHYYNVSYKKILTLLYIVIQGDHGTFTTNDFAEQRAFLFATRNAPFPIKNSESFFKQLIYGE